MFDLNGKNVVYVGGFSGIGYQVCHLLMKKNISHLIVMGRMENVEMMQKLQAENSSVEVVFIHMNLMDRANIEQAVKQVMGVIKHIDVLINGAGVLADKDMETTMGVNLMGMMNMVWLCLPYMDKMQMGQGGIVMNIASVYGLEPAPAFPVYAAAKHGVIGFTRSMAHHYQHTGVAFFVVCPGLTTSEMMVNLREKSMMGQQSYAGELVKAMGHAKHQSPEDCAMNIVNAMEIMKNGAVYLCNMGQLKEVMPTNYWHL
ncbi:development-specific 25 kDa protein isoform X2 [Zeugodacus cucurbitae]|uniref:development-specific 25 kDa protein isoform X2 n=1 Tax=Zeugodacus cucurbitae TaxID=28588 RepID=UPI0023D8E73A|nr:development-specific 25 kDa protein isoform X2 [Zeugodacus cucurbitae]